LYSGVIDTSVNATIANIKVATMSHASPPPEKNAAVLEAKPTTASVA
jgi:hypothetical protein